MYVFVYVGPELVRDPRAYRLVKSDGRFQKFGADLLDALCDLFDVAPGELLEYEGKARRRR